MHTRLPGPLVFVALATACTPGTIAWSTGEDDLRTVIYQTQPLDGASPPTERIRLFLSNGDVGDLDCYMPVNEGDAAEVADGWDRLLFALCREDARHVYVDMFRPTGSAVLGRYETDSDGVPGTFDVFDHWVRGTYTGIDEATTRSGDSLVQDYDVVRSTWGSLGDGGDVVLDSADDDTIRGTFGFPAMNVSGDFVAQRCDERPDQVRILDFLADLAFTPQTPFDPAVFCNQ